MVICLEFPQSDGLHMVWSLVFATVGSSYDRICIFLSEFGCEGVVQGAKGRGMSVVVSNCEGSVK